MKIALVTETYPPEVNGVAMTNQRLVRGLVAKGHEVILIKPRRKGQEGSDQENVSVFPVMGIPVPNYPGLRFGLPRPGRLKSLFRDSSPDVVHVATEGPLGISALRSARKLGIPVTSTFHTNFQDYCAEYGFKFLEKRAIGFLRWFHNACALTTVPDPQLIERLEGYGIERLKMLGRGADTKLFCPSRRDEDLRREWGVGPDDPVAIYVGRAAAEKDIPLALEAWDQAKSECPRMKMVVVGDGPVLKKLRKKWPDVIFAGMRYDEDLARHYASADLFLFASTSETFGNVVIEAMSSGLLVLTYDYAAGQQFIRTGANGHLVAFDDSSAFKAAAERILADRDGWSDVRRAARETAETYPWQKTIDRFEQLLVEASGREDSSEAVFAK